jgi:L,D-transpeptidase YcbB
MDSSYKRVAFFAFSNFSLLFLFSFSIVSCGEKKPSKDVKIVTKTSELNAAVSVQLEELLSGIADTTKREVLRMYNPYSVQSFYNPNYNPVFTSNNTLTPAGTMLKKFIDKDCKYFGLFPKAYHVTSIDKLYTSLTKDSSKNMSAVDWAKMEMYMTDALMQITKHIKNGRLYVDTNYKHFDTSFTKNIFTPLLNSFVKEPNTLVKLLNVYEPKLHDYDSLKIYLKKMLDEASGVEKQYSTVIFPYTDSLKFIKSLINRFKEEGLAQNATDNIDSTELAVLIREYQNKHSQALTGMYSKEMIASMNINSDTKFAKIALTLDKFKTFVVPNKGSYVIVNLPSYTLRGYHGDSVGVESKVAIGKTASKTPIMESEISDIIVMPNWYVPPSILKLPGYIERHRGKKNYVVRGNSVMQKSGPGNALGEMKFNFKSGDAIYLHDTNEKWAFGSSYRAVSHGCVRVQNYKKLASFITTISPISEKDYTKKMDKMKIDSITGDTTYKYKYVVRDSILYTSDTIPGMVKRKIHRELVVVKKVPIYIKYMTCAIRNGVFVMYNDVYGYDKVLQEKYFSGYL